MRAWHQSLRRLRWTASLRCVAHTRGLATRSHERVDVRCGSSGHMTVDLFNVSPNNHEMPLVVNLPPFPTEQKLPSEIPEPLQPPDILKDWPVASINYRWDESHPETDAQGRLPGAWPAPVHDTAFAYAWIIENLAPPHPSRRDILVYGSFVGASLAMSLALTESHSHARFGVRGVATYNGIYNWTMFLPQHTIHRPKRATIKDLLTTKTLANGERLERLHELMSDFFREPTNLFDPFASPSLFFHNPGLDVPRTFDPDSGPLNRVISVMQGNTSDEEDPEPPKPPRKSHLIFPPRTSTLRIPETLLLYDQTVLKAQTGRRSAKPKGHTFETQAEELSDLMRRSIEKVELKDRGKWDDEMDVWEDEPYRRVQTEAVEEPTGSLLMSADARKRLSTWLEDRA